MLGAMGHTGAPAMNPREVDATASSMVVLLIYWRSFEYERNLHHAVQPKNAKPALIAARTMCSAC
jgi:hypothetical protein